jgi:hypothetical protein
VKERDFSRVYIYLQAERLCWRIRFRVTDATAFRKTFIIFHFPFVILDLPLKKLGSSGFSSMANLKLQMENGK